MCRQTKLNPHIVSILRCQPCEFSLHGVSSGLSCGRVGLTLILGAPWPAKFCMSILAELPNNPTQMGHPVLKWTRTYTGWVGHLFRRFRKLFSESSQAVGLYCSRHAAQARKRNFQKTCYETFGTNGRPTQYNGMSLRFLCSCTTPTAPRTSSTSC